MCVKNPTIWAQVCQNRVKTITHVPERSVCIMSRHITALQILIDYHFCPSRFLELFLPFIYFKQITFAFVFQPTGHRQVYSNHEWAREPWCEQGAFAEKPRYNQYN